MIKTMTFRDRTFQVAKGSLHPEHSFFTFAEEERDIREKYWNVKEGDVVVDAGAMYGSYTLPACAMGAIVHAFEPERLVYHDLVENIKLNGWLGTRCFPQNVGLWDEPTTVDFRTYAPHWPAHTISGPYEMTTLDSWALWHSAGPLGRLDWIKVDVEGAEEHALRGGLETIRRFRPKLLVECHTFLDGQMVDKVKSLLLDAHGDYTFEEIPRDPCVMLVVT